MKTFYLLRHEDLHGHAGLGVVAEGIIFDSGMGAFTWLSDIPTITTFRRIQDVVKLHSHGGRTEIIIEGKRSQKAEFEKCKELAREKKKLPKKVAVSSGVSVGKISGSAEQIQSIPRDGTQPSPKKIVTITHTAGDNEPTRTEEDKC